MTYVPAYNIKDPNIANELLRISQELQESDSFFPKIYYPPTKPREGMVRYADGTEWNPQASKKGLYVFDGDAWVALQAGYKVYNVKDFGAVGDNSTDDTVAIQAALDAVEANGGGLFFPEGFYKVTSALTIDGQTGTGAEFGINLFGANKRTTRLVSYLSSGTMLFIGNGSSTPQNGVNITDLGFVSDSTAGEDILVHVEYGLDARIQNNLFLEAHGIQLKLGRAQNVLVLGNEFRGDSNTDTCILVIESAANDAGQGCIIQRNTIRGARGTEGIGVWLDNTGGGEHSILSNMIEGNKIGIRLESSRHNVFDNSFENSTSTDIQLQIAEPAGSRASHHYVAYNRFSASSMSNFKCVDAQIYSSIRFENNRFFNTSGQNVYFGSDENNTPSFFINNECPMSAVSFGGTDGKVIVYGNTNNGTNNPRVTLADAETTPSVANYDLIVTANTGATTITNFLNGYPGKTIMVSVEDANTTIADGARINTLTNANLTPANGDILIFKAYVGSGATNLIVWQQLPGIHATQLQAGSSGLFTVASASVNAGNTSGWFQICPGIWVPYSTNPAP